MCNILQSSRNSKLFLPFLKTNKQTNKQKRKFVERWRGIKSERMLPAVVQGVPVVSLVQNKVHEEVAAKQTLQIQQTVQFINIWNNE